MKNCGFTAKVSSLRECTSFEPFCVKIGWRGLTSRGEPEQKSQKVSDSHGNDRPVTSATKMVAH